MLTVDQLKKHNKYITGSKVASILGLNPWESKYELFARMKGLLPPKETTQKMKAGLYAEEMIEKWCIKEWGWSVVQLTKDTAWKQHSKYNFLGGYIDRLKFTEEGKKSHVLEFKNISEQFKRIWGEGIPVYYQAQMYFYSILWNLPSIAVACFGGNDFQFFELQRNSKIEEFIIEESLKFWDDLQSDKWPNIDLTKSTSDTLKQLFPKSNTQIIAGGQEQYDFAIKYNQWKEKKKEAEKEMLGCANYLQNELKDNEGFLFSDGSKCTWKKSKDSERFDLDKFKIEQPEIYKKYIKTTEGPRVFRVNISEGLTIRSLYN